MRVAHFKFIGEEVGEGQWGVVSGWEKFPKKNRVQGGEKIKLQK
jgi:hypothetical protein